MINVFKAGWILIGCQCLVLSARKQIKHIWTVVAYCIESRTCNPKVTGSSLRSGRNCRWGEWITSTFSALNTTTEVPLTEPPTAPRTRSIGCPLLRVCVHGVCVCVCALGWVKCKAQIPSMDQLYLATCHVTSLSFRFSFFKGISMISFLGSIIVIVVMNMMK